MSGRARAIKRVPVAFYLRGVCSYLLLSMFWRRDEKPGHFNPDDFRMTVGEHLEDLRRRLIYALVGFVMATCVCLFYGRSTIIPIFTRPLTTTLAKYGLSTQLHSDEVPDIFTTYLQICFICGTAIASPWIVYQFWQFVAAGLYPNERRYITRYVPLSIGLLITGMLFVYFFVLPWTLEFFIAFSVGVPMKLDAAPPPPGAQNVTGLPRFIEIVNGSPNDHKPGQISSD